MRLHYLYVIFSHFISKLKEEFSRKIYDIN